MSKRSTPILGDTYGKWRVVSEEIFVCPKTNTSLFLCLCKCGKQIKVAACELKRGRSKSCRNCSKRKEEHIEDHELYACYSDIRHRTGSLKAKNYHRYGGRGITLHQDFGNFESFCDYIEKSLGKKPDKNFSLDRVDNERGYEPGNLRWADKTTQARNKSIPTRSYSECNGDVIYLSDLSRLLKLPMSFLGDRWSEGTITSEGVIREAVRLKRKITPIMQDYNSEYFIRFN